jgi:hypothetical protein
VRLGTLEGVVLGTARVALALGVSEGISLAAGIVAVACACVRPGEGVEEATGKTLGVTGERAVGRKTDPPQPIQSLRRLVMKRQLSSRQRFDGVIPMRQDLFTAIPIPE